MLLSKKVVVGMAALLLLGAVPVKAAERWVSDSLSTYVRSGPTDGYRIVGSLGSGEKVQLLTTQGDYAQVQTVSGSRVWIASKELQNQPGPAERVPALEAEVQRLSEQLKTLDDQWQVRVQGMQETLVSRKALVEELQARNQRLASELETEQRQLRDAQARLGSENQQALMQYMLYGGSLAGVGMVAGLLLPLLGRVRGRKRQSEWV